MLVGLAVFLSASLPMKPIRVILSRYTAAAVRKSLLSGADANLATHKGGHPAKRCFELSTATRPERTRLTMISGLTPPPLARRETGFHEVPGQLHTEPRLIGHLHQPVLHL